MKQLVRITVVAFLAGCARSEPWSTDVAGAGGNDPAGAAGAPGGSTGTAGTPGNAGSPGLGGTPGLGGASGVAGMTGVAGGGRGGSAAGSGGRGGGGGGAAGRGGGGGRAGGGAGSSGAAGSSGTCGGPVCGPSVVQLFDNSKLATIRITFDAADTGTYTPAKWLDLLWSKWGHCPPFEKADFARVTFQYESPDGIGNAS